MKGNNGKGNRPLRDMWETPQDFWTALDNQYYFTIDCCASIENSKCSSFFSEDNPFEDADFLKNRNNRCWMNPPFSIAWKMFETFFSKVNKGVAIYRCDNLETGIYQKLIFPHASWIFILDKRINYEGLDGAGSRFPSALIGLNLPPPREIKGTLLRVQNDRMG